VKSVFHVRIIERRSGAFMACPIRFKSKRKGGPFEVGPSIVAAPPGSDLTWEDAVDLCTERIYRLADLLDQRRHRRTA
jgi:hypothetical protein